MPAPPFAAPTPPAASASSAEDGSAALGGEETPLLAAQATELEKLLPALSRQIFALPPPPNPLADLPIAQFRLCILLSREGRRTMSQLSEELHISVSAVTQMADRLEKSDLVERVMEDGDRRTRHLQLTAHGQNLILSRRALRTERAAQTLAMLPTEKREAILQILSELLAASRALPKPDVPLMAPRTDESL